MIDIFGIKKEAKEVVKQVTEFYKTGTDKFAKSQIKWQHYFKNIEMEKKFINRNEFLSSRKRGLTKDELQELEYIEWYIKRYDLKE